MRFPGWQREAMKRLERKILCRGRDAPGGERRASRPRSSGPFGRAKVAGRGRPQAGAWGLRSKRERPDKERRASRPRSSGPFGQAKDGGPGTPPGRSLGTQIEGWAAPTEGVGLPGQGRRDPSVEQRWRAGDAPRPEPGDSDRSVSAPTRSVGLPDQDRRDASAKLRMAGRGRPQAGA